MWENTLSTSVSELKGGASAQINNPSAPLKAASVTPFLVSPSQASPSGGTKELVMHCLMYGTSLYSELNEYREYRASNVHKVAYSSSAFSQV